MFCITDDDVFAVYKQLKDRYDLVMTTTFAADAGFEEDSPLLLANAHGLVLLLYAWGGDFVLDVMDADLKKGTHWHPFDVESAVKDIVQFMEAKPNYDLCRFPKQ